MQDKAALNFLPVVLFSDEVEPAERGRSVYASDAVKEKESLK